jgi:hypothetical protein
MLPGFASKLRSRCSSGSSQSCGQLDKHFTIVSYGLNKVSRMPSHTHTAVQYFQNTLAYFDKAVSCPSKMFMKSTPEANLIKPFLSVIYIFLY